MNKTFINKFWRKRTLFLMILPAVIFFIVFGYLPMAGSIIAFKEYNMKGGIFFSPWVGLNNFKFFFISGQAWQVTKNTFLYNLAFIISTTLIQMTMAIFLAEMNSKLYRKITQSLMFLPYFISWVIVASFVYNIFNFEYGTLNTFLKFIGHGAINVYDMPGIWKYILVFADNWKWLGYGSVLYLASITGIDTGIYESAEIDGANKFQKIMHITIPLLVPTIIILTLLSIGRIFRGDFDMFYQLIGDAGNLLDSTDVIDTFVFRSLIRSGDYGMSSAAAFYQSILCFFTITIVNWIVRKIDKDSALY